MLRLSRLSLTAALANWGDTMRSILHRHTLWRYSLLHHTCQPCRELRLMSDFLMARLADAGSIISFVRRFVDSRWSRD
jgi:hypothetical protein